MNKSQLHIFLITIVLLIGSWKEPLPIGMKDQITVPDSLLIRKYMTEIERENVLDSDSLSGDVVDSLFYESGMNFGDSKVSYSPDSTFKIFVIELIGNGVYSNSSWYSWTHFNLKKREVIKSADFSNYINNFTIIEGIYKLPDNKYLVLQSSYGRTASVLSVKCGEAKLISFTEDSIKTHPINYRGNSDFSFCEENVVDSEGEPYLSYDTGKKVLSYRYGNNYEYSDRIDVDTLRQGSFRYKKGRFVLEKETIKVNTNRPK